MNPFLKCHEESCSECREDIKSINSSRIAVNKLCNEVVNFSGMENGENGNREVDNAANREILNCSEM